MGRWNISAVVLSDQCVSVTWVSNSNNLNIAVLCDYGSGDKGKVERLRQSQILKTGRVVTAADFSGKAESDIEDLFDDNFYCSLVNRAYGLENGDLVTLDRLTAAGAGTVRIVKQMEAIFRAMPADRPEFGHFGPADYVLRHPDVLDGETPEVLASLEKFEAAFKVLNGFLD